MHFMWIIHINFGVANSNTWRSIIRVLGTFFQLSEFQQGGEKDYGETGETNNDFSPFLLRRFLENDLNTVLLLLVVVLL